MEYIPRKHPCVTSRCKSDTRNCLSLFLGMAFAGEQMWAENLSQGLGASHVGHSRTATRRNASPLSGRFAARRRQPAPRREHRKQYRGTNGKTAVGSILVERPRRSRMLLLSVYVRQETRKLVRRPVGGSFASARHLQQDREGCRFRSCQSVRVSEVCGYAKSLNFQ